MLDKRLDDITKRQCDGPITRAELDVSIRKMHLNKSPGPDGLSTEFYQTFWKELAQDLCEVYNYAYTAEHMSDSQTNSLLRLL